MIESVSIISQTKNSRLHTEPSIDHLSNEPVTDAVCDMSPVDREEVRQPPPFVIGYFIHQYMLFNLPNNGRQSALIYMIFNHLSNFVKQIYNGSIESLWYHIPLL